ncbi:MAG TPA: carboxypeptidase regulatory-like domain-containing protein [Tepidisphaeraceae bacterium]
MPTTMKRDIFLLILLMCVGSINLALTLAEQAPAPTTRPAGAAAAGSIIRGRIAVGAGWDLQKPDLSRAVVYLASDPRLDENPPAKRQAVVAQRDKTFVPDFIVVPRGTDVEFPNWDRFYHNVFSRSKAAPAFDLDRYPYGQSKSRTFDKAGVVQMFCNIHPQMRSIVYVTPNPYFARADAQGQFEIKGVPPGDYEVVVWHERCEEQRAKVHVAADQASAVALTLEENRGRIIANAPPEPRGYGGVERGLGVKRERLDLPVVTEVHAAPAKQE